MDLIYTFQNLNKSFFLLLIYGQLSFVANFSTLSTMAVMTQKTSSGISNLKNEGYQNCSPCT